MRKSILAVALATLALAMPHGAFAADKDEDADLDKILARMMSGESAMQDEELDAAMEKASEHPLGSKENPVRASRPQGQRAYLARLRCSDGEPPEYERRGNVGVGVYGNIVDHYLVVCLGSGEPAESQIYMDMYHKDHEEEEAVPGFTIKN